ncbi:VOC family protein [Dyella sp. C9]|uniref:VOC family protein n=1 Tax=Dyella sp. C9 TaxID=2202154 RepID=UPI000DEEB49F|nr:VOC family protein [Dyella sp. C9]
MRFIPYLNFDGDCSEAFDFYAQAFKGTITARMTGGESPMAADMPAAMHGRVMHVQLETTNGIIMGADGPPQSDTHGGVVNIDVATVTEAERVFQALAEGGRVQMPIAETFWAKRFGLLTDRYGKGWMVNCMKQPGG